jgi:hypothetical protein
MTGRAWTLGESAPPRRVALRLYVRRGAGQQAPRDHVRRQSAPVRSHISQACFPKAPIEPTFVPLGVYRETPREYLATHSITSLAAGGYGSSQTVASSERSQNRGSKTSNLVGTHIEAARLASRFIRSPHRWG